jgi:hypothetical protein
VPAYKRVFGSCWRHGTQQLLDGSAPFGKRCGGRR